MFEPVKIQCDTNPNPPAVDSGTCGPPERSTSHHHKSYPFTYLVQESSTGNLYLLQTTTDQNDEIYRAFASRIHKRQDAYSEGFDTGNVDIDFVLIALNELLQFDSHTFSVIPLKVQHA